jgi:hypothetical protein
VDRAELAAESEQLQRFLASGQRFLEHTGRRVRRQPVDGFLGNAGQPAELAKAPVVHLVAAVVAGIQQQLVRHDHMRAERPGRLPDF